MVYGWGKEASSDWFSLRENFSAKHSQENLGSSLDKIDGSDDRLLICISQRKCHIRIIIA